ncbi:hypothetical protein H9P43_003864 [Blastocladiella emersonii ATCC 22665]|nr:hypothetical protein H9P43_003864 [Blastocladiella emersonii ATCC 22665]
MASELGHESPPLDGDGASASVSPAPALSPADVTKSQRRNRAKREREKARKAVAPTLAAAPHPQLHGPSSHMDSAVDLTAAPSALPFPRAPAVAATASTSTAAVLPASVIASLHRLSAEILAGDDDPQPAPAQGPDPVPAPAPGPAAHAVPAAHSADAADSRAAMDAAELLVGRYLRDLLRDGAQGSRARNVPQQLKHRHVVSQLTEWVDSVMRSPGFRMVVNGMDAASAAAAVADLAALAEAEDAADTAALGRAKVVEPDLDPDPEPTREPERKRKRKRNPIWSEDDACVDPWEQSSDGDLMDVDAGGRAGPHFGDLPADVQQLRLRRLAQLISDGVARARGDCASASPATGTGTNNNDAVQLSEQLVAMALVTHLRLLALAVTGGPATGAAAAAVAAAPHEDAKRRQKQLLYQHRHPYLHLLDALLKVSDDVVAWLLGDLELSWEAWLKLVGLAKNHPAARVLWAAMAQQRSTSAVPLFRGYQFFGALAALSWNAPALARFANPYPARPGFLHDGWTDVVQWARHARCRRANPQTLVSEILSREPIFAQGLANLKALPSSVAPADTPELFRAVGQSLDVLTTHDWSGTCDPGSASSYHGSDPRALGQRERFDAALSTRVEFVQQLINSHALVVGYVGIGPHSWAAVMYSNLEKNNLTQLRRHLNQHQQQCSVWWTTTLGEVLARSAMLGPDAPRNLPTAIRVLREFVPADNQFAEVLRRCCLDIYEGFGVAVREFLARQQRLQVLSLVQVLVAALDPSRAATAASDTFGVVLALYISVADRERNNRAATYRNSGDTAAAAGARAYLAATLSDPSVVRLTVKVLGAASPVAGRQQEVLDQIADSGAADLLLSGMVVASLGGGNPATLSSCAVDFSPLAPLPHGVGGGSDGACPRSPPCPLQQTPAWRHTFEQLLSILRDSLAPKPIISLPDPAKAAIRRFFLDVQRLDPPPSQAEIAAAVARAAATRARNGGRGYVAGYPYGRDPRDPRDPRHNHENTAGTGPACQCDAAAKLTMAAKLCAVAPEMITGLFTTTADAKPADAKPANAQPADLADFDHDGMDVDAGDGVSCAAEVAQLRQREQREWQQQKLDHSRRRRRPLIVSMAGDVR